MQYESLRFARYRMSDPCALENDVKIAVLQDRWLLIFLRHGVVHEFRLGVLSSIISSSFHQRLSQSKLVQDLFRKDRSP